MMSSFTRIIRPLTIAVMAVVYSTLLLAQSTTDGAIGGTVYDTNGAVVPSAKITVHNTGTNAEKAVTSDESGYYRVTNLPSGTYTVTINQPGFAPYKAEQVVVQVGSVTDVSPRLAVGSTTEVVNVTAEAPQINTVSADFAPTLNRTAIENLPINGGRWSSFALLTPGVVSDSNGFGLLSFRGISTLLNNNTVDGADNNQAFFSEERGRTRAGYSTPKAAIEEFQVNTSNYSAEYGRSAGGVVNTVTRSGTNNIHGEAYFYDRDNVWGASNAFTTINVPNAAGVFTSQHFKPTDWRKIAGGAVGGPIIKDKLFFFVTYDWYHRNFPGVGTVGNPNVFFNTNPDPAVDTTGFLAANVAALATNLGLSNADALTLYKADLADLSTVLGQVQRTGEQNIFLPKLDWNINSKNHASFTFNRMRWSSPAGVQTQATVQRGIADFGSDFVKDTWGVAKLNTFLTSSLANELRFQYGRDFEYQFSQQPTPYEVNHLVNTPTFTNPLGLPPGVVLSNFITIGTPNFLQRPQFPDESREQIADTVTWTHGRHNFRFGLDYSRVNDNSQNLFNGFGTYSYQGTTPLGNYFTDLNKQNGCGGKQCYDNFTQGLGLAGLEFTTNEYAFFAQDDWKILPRLSLSLGVRYEYQQMPDPVLGNPALPQSLNLPSDANNFGPRLGFAWDVTGDGKTVLRGGWGMYYGRAVNSTIFNALINTGAPGSQTSLTFKPGDPGAPQFPAILGNLSGAGKNVAFFDPNFQNPQIHQIDLTLEHDLGWDTVFSISYLGSLGRQLPDFGDVNICTAVVAGTGCTRPVQSITYTFSGNGPIPAGTKLTEPLFVQRINPAFGSMTEIFSGTNSSYHALALQLNHRLSHHVQFSANYTVSHATDYGQNQSTFTDTNDLFLPLTIPNAIALEKGRSIYDVPYRFVLNAVATSPWKTNGWTRWFTNDWQISPIFQIQNGLPITLTTSGTPAAIAPDKAVGSGITGSGGAQRIDIIGRNTFRLPRTWVQDLRVSKFLSFQERYKLELDADFFNIANKQNVTQENSLGYTIAGGTLKFNAPFGTITNSNSNFTYTPRQIQLGVRVHF